MVVPGPRQECDAYVVTDRLAGTGGSISRVERVVGGLGELEGVGLKLDSAASRARRVLRKSSLWFWILFEKVDSLRVRGKGRVLSVESKSLCERLCCEAYS